MTSSRLARLVGFSLSGIASSEAINARIWAGNTAAGVHLNGSLLFVAGLALVMAHNRWVRGWPVVLTLVGWCGLLLGAFRMLAPELVLRGAGNTTAVIASATVTASVGVFLVVCSYRREP